MAKETIIRLTDDIDGSEAAESVTFGFRGVEYEIDLSEKNLRGMEKAFAKWIDHGRVVVVDGTDGEAAAAVAEPAPEPAPAPAPARRPRTRRTAKAQAKDPAAIREWAKANGFTVSTRGRISSEVQQAFEAANR